MKKLIFTIGLAGVIAFNSSAQIETGKVFLGGTTNLGFGSTSYKVDRKITAPTSSDTSYKVSSTANFALAPMVGYFITDGLLGGLIIDMWTTSTKDEDDDKYSTTNVELGPFIRYYFITEGFAPYIHADIGFGKSSWKFTPKTGKEIKDSQSISGWSIGAGASLFVNDNVAIDMGLGYESTTYTDKMTQADDGVDGKVKDKYGSFGLNIGVIVLL